MLDRLITTIPDGTETYFLCNDVLPVAPDDILHRRTAICICGSDRIKGDDFAVFMDEGGRILPYDETRFDVVEAYDSFTVGVPRHLHTVTHFTKFLDRPECLVPLLRLLRSKGVSFVRPKGNAVRLDVEYDYCRDGFLLINRDGMNAGESVLPIGDSSDVWDCEFLPGSLEPLVLLGRKLALFRYAFGMPALRFELFFRRTEEWGEDYWNGTYEESGETVPEPFAQRCRRDADNETRYRVVWEKTIRDSAGKFAMEHTIY